tara:strand:- start:181 stop:453 length:273 start_codon:yes stop_codon:yes gene_type:complete
MGSRLKPYYSLINFIERDKAHDSNAASRMQVVSNLVLRLGGGTGVGAGVGAMLGDTIGGAIIGASLGIVEGAVELIITTYREMNEDNLYI